MSNHADHVPSNAHVSATGYIGRVAPVPRVEVSSSSYVGALQQLTVSVIICAYTEARFSELLEAIDSVRRQRASAYEIIVVVDHNAHLLSRLRDCVSDALLIENGYRKGLSGARNTGLAVARGEFVAFLDDDAAADPLWLSYLLTGFSDPQVLGAGGFIEPIWDAGRPAWFPDEFLWVVGCSYRGLPLTPAPVRNLIGCNMAFRRQACIDLGGFSDAFGHVGERPYGDEETEFCIRMRQRWPDGVLLYMPQARVRHHVTAARTRWRYFRDRCSLEGASKAALSVIVGARDGLATERTYTQKVLPAGALHGCADLIVRGDMSGVMRSYAIAMGLMSTAVAFARKRIAQCLSRPIRPQTTRSEPTNQISPN